MNHFVLIICIGLTLLLTVEACNPNKPLSEDELAVDSSLVNILVDLRLVDARAELTNMPGDEHDSLRAVTLERHNETEASFARRIDDDANHPQKLEHLLEEVQTALSLERQGEVWDSDTTDH